MAMAKYRPASSRGAENGECQHNRREYGSNGMNRRAWYVFAEGAGGKIFPSKASEHRKRQAAAIGGVVEIYLVAKAELLGDGGILSSCHERLNIMSWRREA